MSTDFRYYSSMTGRDEFGRFVRLPDKFPTLLGKPRPEGVKIEMSMVYRDARGRYCTMSAFKVSQYYTHRAMREMADAATITT